MSVCVWCVCVCVCTCVHVCIPTDLAAGMQGLSIHPGLTHTVPSSQVLVMHTVYSVVWTHACVWVRLCERVLRTEHVCIVQVDQSLVV